MNWNCSSFPTPFSKGFFVVVLFFFSSHLLSCANLNGFFSDENGRYQAASQFLARCNGIARFKWDSSLPNFSCKEGFINVKIFVLYSCYSDPECITILSKGEWERALFCFHFFPFTWMLRVKQVANHGLKWAVKRIWETNSIYGPISVDSFVIFGSVKGIESLTTI